MARVRWLPGIEVHDEGVGFELIAPPLALVQLAEALDHLVGTFSEGVVSTEITPDDRSVLVFRLTNGPVVISHERMHVQVVGGRAELDGLAAFLRSVAAGPSKPSGVSHHAHLEHYPGHPWLGTDSEPVVISLSGWPHQPGL